MKTTTRKIAAALLAAAALATLAGCADKSAEGRLRMGEELVSRGSDADIAEGLRALFDAYYALPGATKIVFDLELYVRGRAVDGLYAAIGDDERQVRTEPTRHVTPALKKVFGGGR